MVERVEITSAPAPVEAPVAAPAVEQTPEEIEAAKLAAEETPVEQTPEEIAAAKLAAEETPAEDEVKEELEAAGIDYSSLETEVNDTGELSPESLDKLVKMGFPADVVNEVVAQRIAAADTGRAELMSVVGGEEQFAIKAAWAVEGMSPAAVAEFNSSMEGKDSTRRANAMAALESAYVKANGKVPNLINPTSQATSQTAYRSLTELLADQANPRYKSDPAFRTDVEAKLKRSKI